MAVPKQKQSHSRTTKRRSTHKIEALAHKLARACFHILKEAKRLT